MNRIMKTVVIPSDFTLESVQVAEAIVRNEQEQVRIVFTHLFHISEDIQDLLFSTYRKKEHDYVSAKFQQELSMIKSMYPHLVDFKVEFFYGGRLAGFKHFLEYHEADAIGYSERLGVNNLCKSSIDAVPIIKKCGLPLINTDQIRENSYADLMATQ